MEILTKELNAQIQKINNCPVSYTKLKTLYFSRDDFYKKIQVTII